MDNYYNRPEVSNSDLSRLKEDRIPAHIRNSAQRFGKLVDAIITEPALLKGYTLEGETYTEEEMKTALQMKMAFFNDPMCSFIHKASSFQQVMIKQSMMIIHNDFSFELDTRCKWDFFMKGKHWGCDLKVTSETSRKGFLRACEQYDYYRGRAFYMDIAGSNQDMLIGISRKNFEVYKVPITRGDRNYNLGKANYQELAHQYYELNHKPSIITAQCDHSVRATIIS